MSASQRAAQHRIAIEVAASLRGYERDIRLLVVTWLDMGLYEEVSVQVDEIRACCALLPEAAVPWIGLLVSHADLVHCLWRSSQAQDRPADAEIQLRLSEHLGCIESLACRCRRIAADSEPQRQHAWG